MADDTTGSQPTADATSGTHPAADHMHVTPIGVIRTPFATRSGMPIQPSGGADFSGTVEVFPDYRDGLVDLDGFSHVVLLYWLHASSGHDLSVVPFLDTSPRGLFATRAPRRPNPIGMSVVALERIEDGVLHFRGVDILDGTPLIDIKPYVPEFDAPTDAPTDARTDAPTDVRIGWLENVSGEAIAARESDGRFD